MKLDAFIDPDVYYQQMDQYLSDLRNQAASQHARVMAAGDREWDVQTIRQVEGIPVDPSLWDQLNQIAAELGISAPLGKVVSRPL